jgi:hypothetical protein
MGVHRSTVAGHLRRVGVELRQHGLTDERLHEAPRPPAAILHVATATGLAEKQLDETTRLYVKSRGCSLQRLVERYGCDDETVLRLCSD